MWIIRWIIIGIIVSIIVGLALQNTEPVLITLFKWHSGQIPIYVVIYFSFLAGMLVFLLLAAYHQVRKTIELRQCKKEIRLLQEELDEINNTSSDNGEDDDEDENDDDYDNH
ncbi:MAG: LapA family protein [Candidatus Hatepunaea meridiana]|nr:LapA family protein [Candidatus Hatepunaea meridiana]